MSAHGGQGRDLRGYGDRRPDPHWPADARLAVSFVVNVEEGAELSVSLGDERNEAVYEIVEEVAGAPDPCKDTHFDYGTRAGYWRIMALFDRYSMPATMNCCARALTLSPWLAQDAVERGHEIACHSYRWERHAGMAEDHERAVIARCVAEIRAAAGVRPLGWHTRSAPSANTRRLLVEEGGFLYDSDAYNDDLPYLTEVAGRPHVVLPYAFDTNDMRFQRQGGFTHADDFARYCTDAIDWLWEEGGRAPKMLSIGLHLRIVGRPGRIAGLDKVLAHIAGKGQVWVARRDRIARHWRALSGLPAWEE
ncbi:polysaccharide deacetylase family protein [Thalassobaculum sp.]|uniref:polysaccharide deacetylase family protein n=1 Tax=Thalassobaculum sp. TaxID=2022740 RepID=UPI0032EBCDB1